MGTRSVITTNPEAKGRYVHWDGYPTGVGQAILNIVRRDGVERARAVLTAEHFGWSSVTGQAAADMPPVREPERFVNVDGYGTAYTHTEHHDEWAQEVDTEEYGYIIGDTFLTILDVAGDRSISVAHDLPADEQTDLLNAFENDED